MTNFGGVLFWKMEINFSVKQHNFYHRCPIILNKNFVRGPCGGRQRDDLPGSPLEFPLIGENCAYIAEGDRRPCAATSGFWATICKTVRPVLSVRCPVCLSVLSVTLVYCGQTVGRIKMKLGMQVGLGPDHIVLGGDPADPPSKGHSPLPIFGPCLSRPNGWMDEAGTWHGGRPQPRWLCVRWGPRPLPSKGGSALPNFRLISIVAKWLHASKCHLVWN